MNRPFLSISSTLDAAEHHMLAEGLRGWDPFDGLCSPLFGLPVLRSHRPLRFVAQQVIRRLPFNVRPLLGVPKQLNPVSVGLFVQGLAHRARAEPHTYAARRALAEHWTDVLEDLASTGWSGPCWGYPFDWESRYGTIAADVPTVVATGIITNALVEVDRVFDLPAARELVLGAARFVRQDLNRIPGPQGSFCWSYSPCDRQAVLNATMKGSRLLCQATALGADATIIDDARASARFVALHQDKRGAWPYSVADRRRWADNFHTGYVLECMHSYVAQTGDAEITAAMDRGWRYYREHFFAPDMTPKFLDNRTLPTDATACAQAIITLVTFGDLAGAEAALERSVSALGLADGSFAYQRRRRTSVRIPYLRWSTAWMYCALARVAAQRANPRSGAQCPPAN